MAWQLPAALTAVGAVGGALSGARREDRKWWGSGLAGGLVGFSTGTAINRGAWGTAIGSAIGGISGATGQHGILMTSGTYGFVGAGLHGLVNRGIEYANLRPLNESASDTIWHMADNYLQAWKTRQAAKPQDYFAMAKKATGNPRLGRFGNKLTSAIEAIESNLKEER